MADNLTILDAGSVTRTVAFDELAGSVFIPRAKIAWGIDGSSVDASATNPLPVTIHTAAGVEVTFGDSAQLPPSTGRQTIANSLATVPTSQGFDSVLVPTVTNGAYAANDVIGGLLTIDTGLAVDQPFVLNELVFAFKSAVTPSLVAHIFEAAPTAMADNAAYTLGTVADVFKLRASLPVAALGGYLTDHGTPNTYRLQNINLVMLPVSGTNDFYIYLQDTTGVTLTSTSDLQVRACGMAV